MGKFKRSLLKESVRSEKAKSLGLSHVAFKQYKDKTGKKWFWDDEEYEFSEYHDLDTDKEYQKANKEHRIHSYFFPFIKKWASDYVNAIKELDELHNYGGKKDTLSQDEKSKLQNQDWRNKHMNLKVIIEKSIRELNEKLGSNTPKGNRKYYTKDNKLVSNFDDAIKTWL